MRHDEKPRRPEEPHHDSRDQIRRIISTSYYRSLQSLPNAVRGKVVTGSQAGTSGFVLLFGDESWAASYLEGDTLLYELGKGKPSRTTLAWLNSADCGDAREQLTANLPYAKEPCDIPGEVAKAHGRAVTSVSIGDRSFNFCFPDGWELDTIVVPDRSGKMALRVFFEQW